MSASVTDTLNAAWDDTQRQETIIKSVRVSETGYDITQESGWGCWLPKEHGVEPITGETLTLWGRGIGYAFRGLAVGDRVAFYRTEAEDDLYQKVQRYGVDAADWLKKWDSGKGVWTIQMGGLSAGYDQCINLMTAEFVRALVKLQPDTDDMDTLGKVLDAECAASIETLSMSGAQYGAALGLALRLYKFGPINVMESAPDDRRVQASKNYPTLDPVKLAAPDLLASLKELKAILATAMMPDCPTLSALIDASARADIAIAKATGESQ